MNADENTPKEYGGKQYTVYEALQRQRRMESSLRKRREEIHLLEQGEADEDDILAAKAKYYALSNEYAQFSKAMHLPQQRERVSIDGRKGVDVSFGTQTATNQPKQTAVSKQKPEISTPKEENLPINGDDVKAEYDKNATPGKGKITFDDNFDKTKHKAEIDFAEWLHSKYGGEIHLLQESTAESVKTPDYIWNGKYWDLKNTTTEKAANSAVRKGLKQIEINPGGIMLNYADKDISLELVKEQIIKRMKYKTADIMIVCQGEVKAILRYKN